MGLKPLFVYLDSCLVIYLVEEHPIFAPLLETYIANAPDLILAVSDLTEMECLVMPFRKNNQPLIVKFQKWFEQVSVISPGKEIFHQAARLRANFPTVKLPTRFILPPPFITTAANFGQTTIGSIKSLRIWSKIFSQSENYA